MITAWVAFLHALTYLMANFHPAYFRCGMITNGDERKFIMLEKIAKPQFIAFYKDKTVWENKYLSLPSKGIDSKKY